MRNAPAETPSSDAAPAPSASVRVVRPEPGIARGVWDVPRSVPLVLALVTVVAALAWLALRVRARREASRSPSLAGSSPTGRASAKLSR